ncbi:hypothetical protein [Haloarcula salinisoli]|uniref:Uncharacterized protein n=1 Tax=Haloarcula salinisoli TaxID=2487746 RepID=A0A8J7YGA9_9EURY|nr:hypothetical protein [Halomicroarcula salinisoli]MBX0285658.1 hypothetical protein [Halomicroarcula salinisoli]MBX0302853.1 hypothetical protein [Halomicroarcula salinisoli]
MTEILKQVLLSALLAVVTWVSSALLVFEVEVIKGAVTGLFGELGMLFLVFIAVPAAVGFGAVKALEFEAMWFCLGVGLGYVALITGVSIFAGGGELHPVFLAAWVLPAATCLGAIIDALGRRLRDEASATQEPAGAE